MISLGVLFHMMTWLTLGLWVFPLVCYSAYCAFVNENDVEWMRGVLARWRARGRGLRAAARRLLQRPELGTLARHPALPGATAASRPSRLSRGWAASAWNTSSIPMASGGRRAPTPSRRWIPSTSTKCSPRPAASATKTRCSCSTSGPSCVGGAVLDRRTQFRQGETVRIECDLSPPHEDMWIECNLHDSENRVVDTIGVFVSSEEMRAMFYYNLGDCTMPGKLSAGAQDRRRRDHAPPDHDPAADRTACLANYDRPRTRWPGPWELPRRRRLILFKNFAFFAAAARCRHLCPRVDLPTEGLRQWDPRPGRCFSSVSILSAALFGQWFVQRGTPPAGGRRSSFWRPPAASFSPTGSSSPRPSGSKRAFTGWPRPFRPATSSECMTFFSPQDKADRQLVGQAAGMVEIEGPIRISDLSIDMSSAESRAVATFRASATAKFQGHSDRGHTRWELTWQREGNDWKIIRVRRLSFIGEGEASPLSVME